MYESSTFLAQVVAHLSFLHMQKTVDMSWMQQRLCFLVISQMLRPHLTNVVVLPAKHQHDTAVNIDRSSVWTPFCACSKTNHSQIASRVVVWNKNSVYAKNIQSIENLQRAWLLCKMNKKILVNKYMIGAWKMKTHFTNFLRLHLFHSYNFDQQ